MGDVEKGIKFYNIGRKKGFFNGYYCSHVPSTLLWTSRTSRLDAARTRFI